MCIIVKQVGREEEEDEPEWQVKGGKGYECEEGRTEELSE